MEQYKSNTKNYVVSNATSEVLGNGRTEAIAYPAGCGEYTESVLAKEEKVGSHLEEDYA